MKIEDLKRQLPSPVFDIALVRQAYGMNEREAASFSVQLARWEDQGKLHRLRRGLYAFPESTDQSLAVANQIVSPSYISGEYALGFHGLIPEAVFDVTSACEVAPRRAMYQTPYGRYSYRQIKVFKGFVELTIGGVGVLMAIPEKALLDTWYWATGRWSRDRHREMRYSREAPVETRKLQALARDFQSPRMQEAVENFLSVQAEDRDA